MSKGAKNEPKPDKKYIAAIRWKYDGMYYSHGIDSIRLVTQEEWDKLQRILPKTRINLGEIEGKHSEVFVDIKVQDFQVVSVNPERLEAIRDVFGVQVGFDIVSILFELYPE